MENYVLTEIFWLTNWGIQLEKCRELIQFAKKSLEEEKSYYGIEACNEVLDGHSSIVGHALKFECLCTRAALLLKVLLNFVKLYLASPLNSFYGNILM